MFTFWKRLGAGSLVLLTCLQVTATVSAEEPAAAKASREAPAAAASEVIFTGFARRPDKGASIFVRMTAEVPVAAERSGTRVTYRLSGAKLGVANNKNPLPTEYFDPRVSNVALVPNANGVDLVLDMNGAPPDAPIPGYRFVARGGLSTLHVELPPPPLVK